MFCTIYNIFGKIFKVKCIFNVLTESFMNVIDIDISQPNLTQSYDIFIN